MSTSGRHDRLLTHVVQEGDTASELAERLTVENFRDASGFERDIVAFRKLRTDARVSAARGFLARRKGEPMSDEKQQDIRTIGQVTDDEIVDAIASFGQLGFDVGDIEDDGPWQTLCIALGILPPDECWADRQALDVELSQRLHELCDDGDGPLWEPGGVFGCIVFLHPREWARRLSFCTEDEIYKMLAPKARA